MSISVNKNSRLQMRSRACLFFFACCFCANGIAEVLPKGLAEASPHIMTLEESDTFYKGLLALQQGDGKQALACLQPLAKSGVVDAQVVLAEAFIDSPVRSVRREGLKWLQHSAQNNDWRSQIRLSQIYEQGVLIEKDLDQAKFWLIRSLQSGADEAQYVFAKKNRLVLTRIGAFLKQQQFESAEKELIPLAQAGYQPAQEILGDLYNRGVLGANKKAFSSFWYQKAAERGSRKAKLQLGLLGLSDIAHLSRPGHDNSIGTVASDEALSLLEEAAEPGLANAQYRLGVLFNEGKLVKKDTQIGMKWYQFAASQNHKEAQYALGVRYMLGADVPQDERLANQWFLKAARNGHQKAQHNLAVSYKHGIGVDITESEARQWFNQKGSFDSRQARDSDREFSDLMTSGRRPIDYPWELAKARFSPVTETEPTTLANGANMKQRRPGESGRYYLQISSSQSRKSTEIELARLNLKAEAAEIVERYVDGKKLFVLEYGTFDSQKSAKQERDKIIAQFAKIKPIIKKRNSIKSLVMLTEN